MVAAGTLIEPCHTVADVGVRASLRRMVQRALCHQASLIDWDRSAAYSRAAADAPLRVLAYLRRCGIGIHSQRSVIRLAADVSHLEHEILREPTLDRQAPLLVGGCEQIWIDSGRGVDRAGLRNRRTASRRKR